MILTDGIHLVSDISLEELHAFAKQLNLRREWFQDGLLKGQVPLRREHRVPHYDLTTVRAYRRAAEAGAELVSKRELMRRAIRRRRKLKEE